MNAPGAEASKRARRRELAAERDRLAGGRRAELSAQLCRKAVREALKPLTEKRGRPLTVCVYGAFRSEADPAELADWCFRHGHRVVTPRIREDGDGMELRIVASPADWRPGRWNVPEPDPAKTAVYPLGEELDVVLVPGLAFDSAGGRIGYGGGYYDRLYAQRRAAARSADGTLWLGFGFAFQRTPDALPREPHDLPLDGLATEEGVSWFTGGARMEAGEARDGLTHFNEQGRAVMVDVSDKAATVRTAVAQSRVRMRPETLRRIREGGIAKGDVLAVAQVAGIQAAKRTSDWIPLCHPLPLTGVNIRFSDDGENTLLITAEVKTTGKTGVEMEALTAVSAAALTVYDMCKALQKDMEIGPTKLLVKKGGKSGDYEAEEGTGRGE